MTRLDSAQLDSTWLDSARLSTFQSSLLNRLNNKKNISQCVPEVYRGGSFDFVCLILEVLRAHLLDNKIDVFCVNNEKPKKEKVQFCSQGGGVHPPASLILGAKGIKMQHGTVLFYSINQINFLRLGLGSKVRGENCCAGSLYMVESV